MKLMDDGAEFVSVTRYAHGGRRLGGSNYRPDPVADRERDARRVSGMVPHGRHHRHQAVPPQRFQPPHGGDQRRRLVHRFRNGDQRAASGLQARRSPTISIDRLFGGKSSFQLVPWVLGYFGYFATALRRLPRAGKPSVQVRIPPGMCPCPGRSPGSYWVSGARIWQPTDGVRRRAGSSFSKWRCWERWSRPWACRSTTSFPIRCWSSP